MPYFLFPIIHLPMNHSDHVNLLRPAALSPGGTWADFGAGSGAFTLALRELVGPKAVIYAIDKDRGSLRELEREFRARFGDAANLHILPADFARPVELPPLDGALMANSLHYFRDASTPSGLRPPPPNVGNKAMQNGTPARHLGEGREGDASHASDKPGLLELLRGYLKPKGALLLVEYNVDVGNLWVPYPLSFETWRKLAPQAGFSEPRLLATHPSRFLREFYSAVCYRSEEHDNHLNTKGTKDSKEKP